VFKSLFRSFKSLFGSKDPISPSYFGHKLTILRKIHSKNGYNNSDIYIDGEKICEALHDLFPQGEQVITDFDLLFEGNDQYPLVSELIFNHSNYEQFRSTLLKKQIKSFTVEVLERYLTPIR
jgi:hypothetical protein